MSQSTWNISKAPSQKGKTVIVTGANAGLGFETTLMTAFIAIVATMVVMGPIIMRLSRNIWINMFVSYDKTVVK